MRTLGYTVIVVVLGIVASGVALRGRSGVAAAPAMHTGDPQYDSAGALLRPKDFETWVFVGASTGLSYNGGQVPGPGEFHNVYIRPESYKAYLETGKFPEKTMMALALYQPAEKVAPGHAGYFEGQFDELNFSVKDHAHFPEGWAYFGFGEASHLKESAKAFPKSDCYSCHVKNAADDNVFVQFYPILRPIMESHSHRKEPAR